MADRQIFRKTEKLSLKSPDIIEAVRPIIKVLEELFISYYIGGSIASSLYGIARATMDVDLKQWARSLHLLELLEKAFQDAGI